MQQVDRQIEQRQNEMKTVSEKKKYDLRLTQNFT